MESNIEIVKPKQIIADFGESIRKFFCQFNIRGRSSRSEYWFGELSLIVASCVFIGIFAIMAAIDLKGILAAILSLALFVGLFWLALCGFFNFSRRLHDIGVSAWAILLFPILQTIIVFRERSTEENDMICILVQVFAFVIWLLVGILPSDRKLNEYGDIPYLDSFDNGGSHDQ